MAESKIVLPIEEQVIQFLEAKGYPDFALVILDRTGGVRSRWLAGDGEDAVADRKRGGELHFELEILQAQIVNHQLAVDEPQKIRVPVDMPRVNQKAKTRKSVNQSVRSKHGKR